MSGADGQILAKWRRANTGYIVVGGIVLVFVVMLFCFRGALVERLLQYPMVRVEQAKQELAQMRTTTALEQKLISRLESSYTGALQSFTLNALLGTYLSMGGLFLFGIALLIPALTARRQLA